MANPDRMIGIDPNFKSSYGDKNSSSRTANNPLRLGIDTIRSVARKINQHITPFGVDNNSDRRPSSSSTLNGGKQHDTATRYIDSRQKPRIR